MEILSTINILLSFITLGLSLVMAHEIFQEMPYIFSLRNGRRALIIGLAGLFMFFILENIIVIFYSLLAHPFTTIQINLHIWLQTTLSSVRAILLGFFVYVKFGHKGE